MEGKYYALYVRVSTEEQASSREGSLVSQVQRLKEYLSYQKKEGPYQVYEDEGSGKSTNREQYQKLTEDIVAGKIESVLCTELSRISRSSIHFQQFMQLCKHAGVGFVSLREQFDTATAQGQLILGIFASLAEFESAQISERTAANLQARKRRGLFNGGYVYGYRPRASQRGYLDIVESEAYVVQRIYDEYLKLGSYARVAQWLNEQGYQPRNSKRWYKNTVFQILKNPAYIAKRWVGKELVSMVWQPIIEEKTWQRVQQIFQRNASSRKNRKPAGESHVFLFRGLLYCVHCQSFLQVGAGTSHDGTRYFYYRHPSRERKQLCPLPLTYPAARIENFLSQRISLTLNDEALLESVCNEVFERLCQDREGMKKQVQHLEKEIASMDKEALSLAQTLPFVSAEQGREFITPKLTEIYEGKKRMQDRLFQLQAELSQWEQKVIRPEDVKALASFWKEEFLDLEASLKQRALKMLVEKIEIEKEDKMIAYMRVSKGKELGGIEKEQRGKKWVLERPVWLPGQDLNL